MKNSVKSLLVAAAMTGMLGAAVPVASASAQKPADQTKTAKTHKKAAKTTKKAAAKDKKTKDKNSCKSPNGCSGKNN
jgi:hypothetical protein